MEEWEALFAFHFSMPLGRFGQPRRLRRNPDYAPLSAKQLALGLPAKAWKTVTWREGTRRPLRSRVARVRIRPAHRDHKLDQPREQEWLLIEWPCWEAEPRKYWMSNLAESISLHKLVALGKQRWITERDDQELKQKLGLSHFEGRGWRGFHHHTTLSIAAYGFLVAERSRFPLGPQRSSSTISSPTAARPPPLQLAAGLSGTTHTPSPPCASSSPDPCSVNFAAAPSAFLYAYDTSTSSPPDKQSGPERERPAHRVASPGGETCQQPGEAPPRR